MSLDIALEKYYEELAAEMQRENDIRSDCIYFGGPAQIFVDGQLMGTSEPNMIDEDYADWMIAGVRTYSFNLKINWWNKLKLRVFFFRFTDKYYQLRQWWKIFKLKGSR